VQFSILNNPCSPKKGFCKDFLTNSIFAAYSDSLQKPVEGLSEKIEDRSRIGCSVNQRHAEKPEPPQLTRNQSPFKTLIAQDATLISAKLASKRIQQLEYVIQKGDATLHQQ